MITEDYVSFELAKLLKEKGFDEVTSKWYLKYKGEYTLVSRGTAEHPDGSIDVPTLQMAMKWLMKNYGIHIIAVPNGIGENVFYMGIYKKYDCGWTYISDGFDEEFKEAEFYTPEEACEAAIKYCLENLI